MKVHIWSDYVCPFCYIGKRKFEQALDRFKHSDQVEVIYKSFELDPNAPMDAVKDMYETLAEKYQMSLDKAKEMTRGVAAQAKEVGLDYDFDKMKRTNTRDAHRLTHYASTQGKMQELTERLLKAYFLEGKHIGSHDTLAQLAEEAGLNKDEAVRVLSSREHNDQVEKDINEASKIGVTGVPFFVFGGKYAVSGAQSPDVFLEVLEKVWEEENGSGLIHVGENNEKDKDCSDGSCSI
ncbi:DsbA family oxidoreductase [Jeotgalibacillus proteolyticus]|uniref:Disulfide bond formation protein DsbA n=1 Tax=Jeotgalibacillus proteolyticus TaxID=2082395 RepID=A0A2S5GAW5_9BACL|nr:DsbA family oxidoreductase [Jeotgalibacillus proteolyticus]PPA70130.1 disulfide bond formation protein DsbA [Jeotgalibacillus proteolyticus]